MTQNRLDALSTLVRDDVLYVAIEGVVENTNGLVAYVDTDLDDTSAGFASFASLTDSSGSLDNALGALFTVPATFTVDFGFGTRAMSISNDTTDGYDDRIGWRDVVTGGGADFSWIGFGDAPFVCGADVCETSIPLSVLGAASGDTLAMFVRITNADGDAFGSAQRLPEDGTTADTQDVGMVHTVALP